MRQNLLSQAIGAITVGVEDARSEESHRAASATRNFYAGVLLLLKECLRRKYPELLYERVEPTVVGGARLIWAPRGKATASVETIKRRWNRLDWSMNWAPLDRLRDLRNDIEHGGLEHPRPTLISAMSETYALVAVLLIEHLHEEPTDLFSEETWGRLTSEASAHEELRRRYLASLRAIRTEPTARHGQVQQALEAATCGWCRSDLIRRADDVAYPDTGLVCVDCGAKFDAASAVREVIQEQLDVEAYTAYSSGGQVSHGVCPGCGELAFSIKIDKCVLCGSGRLVDECARCGASMSLDEQHDTHCGYCRHMWNKLQDA